MSASSLPLVTSITPPTSDGEEEEEEEEGERGEELVDEEREERESAAAAAAAANDHVVSRCLALLEESKASAGVDAQGWEVVFESVTSESDRLRIVRRPYGDAPDVFQYRSSGIYPFPADLVAAVITDLAYQPTWDEACCDVRVLEGDLDADGQDVVTWTVVWPWPFSNREYVYRRHAETIHQRKQLGGKAFLLHSKTCEHPRKPKTDSCVRVDLYDAFLAVEALSLSSCRFVFCGVEDPKAALPKWLVNFAVSKGVPQYFASQRKAIEKYEDWNKYCTILNQPLANAFESM